MESDRFEAGAFSVVLGVVVGVVGARVGSADTASVVGRCGYLEQFDDAVEFVGDGRIVDDGRGEVEGRARSARDVGGIGCAFFGRVVGGGCVGVLVAARRDDGDGDLVGGDGPCGVDGVGVRGTRGP